MTNIELFEYSLDNYDKEFDNPVNIIDHQIANGVMVISSNDDKSTTSLMDSNHTLIDLITTYKTLNNISSIPKEHKIKVVQRIINMIETVEHINYTSFCQYFQVFGYSYGRYMETERKELTDEEKVLLLSKILDEYIKNRHDIYFSYGYGDQALQVVADGSTSKRLGKTGINRMVKILEKQKIKREEYFFPDKGDGKEFSALLKENNIEFEFMRKHQGKLPDLVLKIKGAIYIIEHKEIRGSGGAQNQSMVELIEFINQTEVNTNVHYISVLQGNFMKMRLKKSATNIQQPKIKKQYDDIIIGLKKNKLNYFVNGNGLEKLIEEVKSI